ncbi:hypothetical protein F4780DRAFT_687904 [Xylariomycetidae sp. FL0641]|nr:hypothetical protein F4780DRAFT_687904 [Xylariomycetidae sp. FL0641]
MVAKAFSTNATLISSCRYLGIFSGQYQYGGHCTRDGHFTLWKLQEQLNMSSFATLQAAT